MDRSIVTRDGEPVQSDDLPIQADTGSAAPVAGHGRGINPFRKLWEMGYRRLVPIVPPLAELSPHSSISRRPQSRGKAVGELGQHGWRGFNWHQHETCEADLIRWFTMEAGVGVRTGEGLIAIDIDSLAPELSEKARAAAVEILGPAPQRVGRAPKVLLLYRITEPMAYERVEFTGQEGKRERVEMLSEGRQAVLGGIHPHTLQPYSWPERLKPFDELTIVTPEKVKAYFARLAEILPEATVPSFNHPNSEKVLPLEDLIGTVDAVRKAVQAIPNDTRDREGYIWLGIAIKTALPHDPEAAFDIFWDWCAKWTAGTKDLNNAISDFGGFFPGRVLGASYLYKRAARYTGENMMPEDKFFEPITGELETGPAPTPKVQASDTFTLLGLDGLLHMPDPVYLVDRHLPEASLGFLYGDPGTGKSFIALDWALHIAFGLKAWHGDPILAPAGAHVVYIAGEGVAGLKLRVQAWMHRHNVVGADARFSLLRHSVDLMDKEQVLKLARTIRADAFGTVLVVVDTVSRSMPGAEENQQKEMTRFVDACDVIRTEFQCVVLGVHHAAKQGGRMRGSTVLSAAGDFVFKLERKPGKPVGRLLSEKQKDAPDGWSEPYRFDVVKLPDGKDSVVVSRCLTSDGNGAPVPVEQEERILESIDAAWRSKDPWGQNSRSRDRYAVTRLVKEFGVDADRAKELLQTWLDMGAIAIDTVDSHSKRKGYRRVQEVPEAFPSGSVFD
ncbi:AAA family ATPase [Methylobacterium soli]|uniref:AAA family ATPase n=1 Tax=Methylobacterium soli TaxID=553447 RepID=A0A6L3SVG9_9HYPH|nr:AAA family ATPase [Methylobacterium soli]KAB1075392.1 AAA family ATPase [Methylobacterium soli]GJE43783.1 hypothetical protein AEGHOMDF_2962 [Methylobacterium soli]